MSKPRIDIAKTVRLRLYSWLKAPLLGATSPTVVECSDSVLSIRIPCSRKNRNSRNGLAFGSILIAGECAAVGLFAEAIGASRSGAGLVVSQCSVRFVRELRSAGTFEIRLDRPAREYLRIVELQTSSLKVPLRVTGRDEAGRICAELEFELTLQPPRRSRTAQLQARAA
jgi:hypothetical protein